MITEYYVSFEVAKLLKEKGFDCKKESITAMYGEDGEFYSLSSANPYYFNWEDFDENDYPAPTLQMAMKWLREVHHLFIAIHPRLSFTDYYWITADVYRVKRKSSLYHTEDVDDYNCIASCDETSFEEACNAAIKYCLENLI